jgi:type II secretory pathway component GspD/PulD (secretin)
MRFALTRIAAATLAVGSIAVGTLSSPPAREPASAANVAATQAPGVFPVQNGDADRIAKILRTLYAHARIVVDRTSNSIIAFASAAQIEQMRTVVSQLDVRNPTRAQTTAIAVHTVSPASLVSKLHVLFPSARISAGPNKSLLVDATPTDLAQIKDIVAAIDVAPTAPPAVARTTDAVKLQAANASDVVRVIASQVPSVHASTSGNLVLLAGPADAVAQAKVLIGQIDVPPETTSYTQIYRLRSVDAQSVANLLQRSFPSITITVEKDLNAITVFASSAVQARIAAGIEQLDGGMHVARAEPIVAQPGAASLPINAGDGQSVEVVSLRAAIPALGTTGGSSTAQDIANTVQSALARSAPGLHISVQPNSTQLVLTGTPDEIQLGKELIDQLDVSQKLVVLDTEILEVDETVAKNLGLSVQSTAAGATVPGISTVVSELVPTPQPNFSSPPQFLGLLPFTRTGLSLGVQLNLLVQHGDARILADPRITTISGRTATIRAGDNITVQTQTAGSATTGITTQLQTFQTGVSLDITPVIDAGNFISISLHPVVNNLSGYNAQQIPQISTRDTQTTVGLLADQTLVIGGLIEDSTTHTDTKIPLLGDIPVLGRAFHNTQTSRQRNELIITVTPHIIEPGSAAPGAMLGTPTFGEIPTAQPLPTLEPGTLLPTARPLGFTTSPPLAKPLARSTPVALPSHSPGPSASGSPLPTPSAFANANTFTYGSAPVNTFALASDPLKIYFVTLTPTIMHNNSPFSISVITSSNVTQLLLDTNSGTQQLAHSGGPGMWQASIVFQGSNVTNGQNNLNFILIATKDDGTTQRMTIPVSYAP